MQCYLDTEFCDREQIDQRVDLISLGLISDTGRTFYVELLDGWEPNCCNLFVQGEILPILGAPGVQRMRRKACAAALWSWLQEAAGGEVLEIIYDYELDGALCRKLLAEVPAGDVGIELRLLLLRGLEVSDYQQAFENFFIRNKDRIRHHALHDAEGLRYAYGRLGWQA